VKQQYVDNIDWIKHAHHHNLVSISLYIIIKPPEPKIIIIIMVNNLQ